MRISRVFIVGPISLFLFLGPQPIFSAEDSGAIPTQGQRSTPEKIFVEFLDGDVDSPQINGYIQEPETSTTSAFRSGRYLAVIPNCVEVNPFPCIKSIGLKYQSETVWENLVLSGYVPQTTVANISTSLTGKSIINYSSKWSGDISRLIPSSGEAQIYSSSKHLHKGGNQYVLKGRIDGLSGTLKPNVFAPQSLAITVLPIKGRGLTSQGNLAATSYQFPEDIEVKLELYLGNFYQALSGWFFGRTTNTIISMNPSNKTLTISATPAKVPVHTGYIPFPPPAELQEFFSASFMDSYKKSQSNFRYLVAQPTTLSIWKKYEKYLSKASDFERTVWNINSTTNIVNTSATTYKKCIASGSGFAGLITSNASVFSQDAPTWDAREATLSYQVASPSLDSKGNKNSGNYQIALREDVAKCLWGVDLGNAKVEISVLGDKSEEKQIAVTNFRSQSGWIYFSASGFHYSAPRIRVSVKQGIPSETVTPTPEAQSLAPRITITCQKGTVSKKVSASNPKCPTGYKKKP